MKPVTAQQKPPVPGRNVIDGDVVYFNHAKHGPLSGRVASIGTHGVTVEHETGDDGYHRVLWDDVLGHKERRVRKLTLLERGEDGGIAVDEDGKRVFVEGDLPESDTVKPAGDDLQKAHAGPHAPLLVDIGHLHGEACDCALESLYKALSDDDGLAHDIWEQHQNPFIRALVEKFSERGLTKLAKVQTDLAGWMAGEFHVPSKAPIAVPPGFMGRWTQEELELVRIYLSNIPPAEMTLDDWSMLINYMVQRYLPPESLNEEAEWLAVKAGLMGKVQAHMGDASAEVASAIAEALPSTVSEAAVMFNLSDATEAILDYGAAHACDAVVALSEGARHRLKRVILDHERQKLLGSDQPAGTLQQKLFDEFATLNRDWRRISVTEAGEMANQGVIASLEVGATVRRLEMYRGACPFCRKLDGRVFTVVSPSDPEKDGWKSVWPGKTNIGRSASPRKRVGTALVEREDSERFWPAAGVQHPHCRGRWEPMQAAKPGHDKNFAAWLRKRLGQIEGGMNAKG